MTKGNSEKLTATCTRRQGEALNRLDRIREAARRDKNLRFTSLMHHITVDLLRDSFSALKRDVLYQKTPLKFQPRLEAVIYLMFQVRGRCLL
jgi:hypothetical protein